MRPVARLTLRKKRIYICNKVHIFVPVNVTKSEIMHIQQLLCIIAG